MAKTTETTKEPKIPKEPKTGKEKRQRNLLILLIVLVVVFVAYIGITQYNAYLEDKEEAEEEAEEEASTITVLDIDSSDVYEVYYDNGTDELTFTYDEDEDTWTSEDDTSISITQSYITAIVDDASELTASKEIDDSDDLSDYGLDEPSEEVILYDADGNVLATIYIGDMNSVSSNYYCSVDGDDAVYLISSTLATDISYSLDDITEEDDDDDDDDSDE